MGDFMGTKNEFDYSIFDKPLQQDKKGRYYLPIELYRGSMNKNMLLVAAPPNGYGEEYIYTYKINVNKDGSYWIKGNNIAKHWLGTNFKACDEAPGRLFLSSEIIEQIN
jgi:hypothetical protein